MPPRDATSQSRLGNYKKNDPVSSTNKLHREKRGGGGRGKEEEKRKMERELID